ncbi:conserved hypothetical protein [Austwickia chelonae]|uniref:Calcium/calmodulin-dependent protein kinase II association-domain domain-containing protein n=1 Tax=Austwickia chelonae NBRC 105200 TaxID=1184607 RepID=K6VTB4_9MICO|nr:SgcJ/EcaC family oxidoreductase [Austwickia chelonae]GAB78555.1 hypothetical protein AUCHE_11_00140 [Austwickia chelonae NBRC 105200]SEW40745.1 conserved hypothetical protein [Austwickia chelonae]
MAARTCGSVPHGHAAAKYLDISDEPTEQIAVIRSAWTSEEFQTMDQDKQPNQQSVDVDSDPSEEHAEEQADYAVDRSGVAEAVLEVLPTQDEASRVATEGGDEPAAPSMVVSPHALAAHGYPAPTEEEICALFDRWNAALQKNDIVEVLALYTADAALLAPSSTEICRDTPAKQAFFDEFLTDRPWASVIDRQISRGYGTAVDTGTCTFHFAATGHRVTARYTMNYVWNGRNWLITSHHLSAAQEEKVEKAEKADTAEEK